MVARGGGSGLEVFVVELRWVGEVVFGGEGRGCDGGEEGPEVRGLVRNCVGEAARG